MLQTRKWLNFPTPPLFEALARGNPLECRDEIWHQKTRIVGLPDHRWWWNHAASFLRFDTIPAHNRQTDRRPDTLLSQRPAHSVARVKSRNGKVWGFKHYYIYCDRNDDNNYNNDKDNKWIIIIIASLLTGFIYKRIFHWFNYHMLSMSWVIGSISRVSVRRGVAWLCVDASLVWRKWRRLEVLSDAARRQHTRPATSTHIALEPQLCRSSRCNLNFANSRESIASAETSSVNATTSVLDRYETSSSALHSCPHRMLRSALLTIYKITVILMYGTRPGGRYDMRPCGLQIIDVHKTKSIFTDDMYLKICVHCTMGHWSFWSWFDINRIDSLLTKICAKNDFLQFRSQWPWLLTRDLKFAFLVTRVQRCISNKLPVSMAFLFRENRMHWMDGRTGGRTRRTDGRTVCNT